jgi:hypothetical protein
MEPLAPSKKVEESVEHVCGNHGREGDHEKREVGVELVAQKRNVAHLPHFLQVKEISEIWETETVSPSHRNPKCDTEDEIELQYASPKLRIRKRNSVTTGKTMHRLSTQIHLLLSRSDSRLVQAHLVEHSVSDVDEMQEVVRHRSSKTARETARQRERPRINSGTRGYNGESKLPSKAKLRIIALSVHDHKFFEGLLACAK